MSRNRYRGDGWYSEPTPPREHKGVCNWCHAASKVTTLSLGDSVTTGLTGRERTLCAECRALAENGEWRERWDTAHYAKIEVLSLSAADIVRERFSAKERAELFDFKVAELEQLPLTVVRMQQIREHRCTYECWQHDGQFDYSQRCAIAEAESAAPAVPVPVAFSLLGEWAEWGRSRKQASTVPAHFWGGVGKVAKAAGVLGKPVKAKAAHNVV